MPAPVVTAEMAGQDLVEWAISLSQHSFELVVDDLSEEHRSLSLAQLHRAIQTASITLVEVLQGRDRPFELTRDQVMVVRETARHEFPLRDMVRGLRIVQRHWTEVLLDLAERRFAREERGDAATALLQVLTRFFDDTIDSVMVEYLNERQRLFGCALGTRRELVDRVLTGRGADEAAQLLGVRLEHEHLALVLAGPAGGSGGSGADLRALGEELAWELRACSQVSVPGDGQVVWVWVSRDAPFAGGCPEVVRRVAARHRCERGGIGRPRAGRAGFGQSLADALDAWRIAELGSTNDGLVDVDDVRLAALLGTDLDRVRRFVADELGELAGRQAAMAELRATLRTYFSADRSLVKTASRLYLHRNTVVYRLRRVEQLLGHPVSERTLELHAALELVAVLEDQLLGE